MNYSAPGYIFAFLPGVILAYQLTPHKYRWAAMLAADYLFFWFWSGKLVVYLLASTLIAWFFGSRLFEMKKAPAGMDKALFKKKKHHIVVLAVCIELAILIVLKYTNFIGGNLASLFGLEWHMWKFAVPIGISYYTLQSVSLLCDISAKKIRKKPTLACIALYLSFFPTIVEGPISRYDEVAEQLYAGEPVQAQNIIHGYERIIWGLYKKVFLADHLAPVVTKIFNNYNQYSYFAFFGAIVCTLQLYMDFSGTIDIAIGSAEIFGITLPENFRQPFFAKNAGDFWHRWHITLGTFFRDYIFYPVSLSKPVMKLTKKYREKKWNWPARYAGPMLALLLVWLANGFWHGPYWTYIGYGLYYFVLMFIELMWEKPFEAWFERHHWNGKPLKIIRFIKLVIIVLIGEMFFRAATFSAGWTMLKYWFTSIRPGAMYANLSFLGMDSWDWLTVSAGFIPVIIVSVLNEKQVALREKFDALPMWKQLAVIYAAILVIVIFGAYGPGYNAVAMMYAGF